MSPTALGIILGLVIGKPLCVMLFSWIAVRLNVAALSQGKTWIHLLGVELLAGIGFPVSLFVADLAFGETPSYLSAAKVSVLAATIIADIAGFPFIRRASSDG